LHRLTNAVVSAPIWVWPSGFLLLGMWDLIEWAKDRKGAHLLMAAAWTLLGIIHLLHFAYLRRRLSKLRQQVDVYRALAESDPSGPMKWKS